MGAEKAHLVKVGCRWLTEIMWVESLADSWAWKNPFKYLQFHHTKMVKRRGRNPCIGHPIYYLGHPHALC